MDIEDIQFLVCLAVAVGGGGTVVMVPGKNLVKGILTLIILAGSGALFAALSAEVSVNNFLAGLIISGFVLSLAALCTWVCKEIWRKILQAWRTVKQMDKDDREMRQIDEHLKNMTWRTVKQMDKDDSKKWINNLGKDGQRYAEVGALVFREFWQDAKQIITIDDFVKGVVGLVILVMLIVSLIVALIVHAPLFFLLWLLHTIADALRGG